jgi:hypothetical protein
MSNKRPFLLLLASLLTSVAVTAAAAAPLASAQVRPAHDPPVVLVLLGEWFGDTWFPLEELLTGWGWTIVKAGPDSTFRGCYNKARDVELRSDLHIPGPVDFSRYDALIIPSGPQFRTFAGNEAIPRFLRDAHAAGLVIASLCTGNYVVESAGLSGSIPPRGIPAGRVVMPGDRVLMGSNGGGPPPGDGFESAPVEALCRALARELRVSVPPGADRARGDRAGNILLEKGDQAFEYVTTNQVGLGDFDGDGDLDAVFSNMGFHDSRIWINDGTGRFLDTGQVLTQQGHGVEVADLDGDGDLDIFMTCAGYGVDGVEHNKPSRIYFNDGSGRFTDSGQDLGDTDPSGNAVRLLDLEGDGDLDALVVYYQLPDRIYLNDGRGGFSDRGRVAPESASPGDLDGDGDVDLFLREEGSGYRVLLNDGTGTFLEHWSLADTGLVRGFVVLGDTDGDGDTDAVITNGDMERQTPTRILLNDGAGRFADSGQALTAVTLGRPMLGDLDGDGAPDLVLTSRGAPFRVWVNDGRGGFTDSGFVAAGNRTPFTPVLGDLDGDGDLDLLIAGFADGPVEIWWNRSVR